MPRTPRVTMRCIHARGAWGCGCWVGGDGVLIGRDEGSGVHGEGSSVSDRHGGSRETGAGGVWHGGGGGDGGEVYGKWLGRGTDG